MTKSVIILIPVLKRPKRVAPLLASIADNTPESHRVLFITSPEDLNEQRAIELAHGHYISLHRRPAGGDYARKINWGFKCTTEPFVFLGADDLDFKPGWLSAALRHMEDPRIGVVGTQDLGNPRVLAGQHATHSLVRRTYVNHYGTMDEPGKVLHEGYWHEYVDNELVETAKFRHAWAFAFDSVVEHLHPHWGKGESDVLYDQFKERMRYGKAVFNRRKRLWNPV